MRIRESINISASPERVWSVLADPVMMELWNPKCTRCKVPQSEEVRRGFEFEANFKLNGKESTSRAVVSEFIPLSRIAFTYKMDVPQPDSQATESLEITQTAPNRILVTHQIDMSLSGIPLWARLLIMLIHKFGRRADDSHSNLETLKVLLESELETAV
ncbi:MAG: SRPBCC family protein [Verrucomicrobiota bacterium]